MLNNIKRGEKKKKRERKKGHLILNWINAVVSTLVGKTSYKSINYLTRFAFSVLSTVGAAFCSNRARGAAPPCCGNRSWTRGGGARGRAAATLRGRSAEGPPSGRLYPLRSRGSPGSGSSAPQDGFGAAGPGLSREGRVRQRRRERRSYSVPFPRTVAARSGNIRVVRGSKSAP